mmetsp:Transcript_7178/g.10600  ORF Transcript_7178/g.10600 Transcript_7178/m.10600 type:complete len:299 (+) Transcript_7178:36-932(+)
MKPLAICLLYGVTATLMNITNKFLIFTYEFSCTFIFMAAQYMLSLGIYEALRSKGMKTIPQISYQDALDTLPVTLCFLGSIVFGLSGMAYVNLPMYVALRKLSTLVVFLMEIGFSQKLPDKWSSLGICLISLGALVAGSNDLTSDYFGFFLVFLANICTGLQLHLARLLKQKRKNLGALPQSYYNAMLGLPLVCILAYCTEEHISYSMHPYTGHLSFKIALGLACLVGFFCNIAVFLCTTHNSPMATTITGNMKDVVSMLVGLFAFPDVEPTEAFVTGLFCSMLGAAVYSFGKIKNKA